VTSDRVAEFLGKLEGFDLHSQPLVEDVDIWVQQGAARINAALAATNQCDCTFASWADTLLANLNLIAASLLIYGHCGVGFNDDQRSFWDKWLSDQLELIRLGEMDLCQGATGIHYPAYATATPAVTEFQRAEIIANDILANQ
jgi:hypothetical protein